MQGAARSGQDGSRRSAPPVWAHLAVLVLSIVVPLWLLLGVTAWVSMRQARGDYQQQTMMVARNLALELDRELAGFAGLLGALATSPALEDGDLRRFQAQAERVAPAGTAIVLRDRSGQQLVNTLLPFGTPLPVTVAPQVLAADACVFRTAATCVSDLYTGTTDRQPYVLLDAPVVRRDGHVEMALNIGLPAQRVAALLANHRIPPGWAVSVLDRQDRIVARSVEHERFVGSLANPALRASGAAAEGTVRSVNVAGVPVWGAYVRLPDWGWRVAIGVPEEILAAPLRRSAIWLSLLGIAAVGTSFAAALFYGRRIARSIGALSRQAAEVGAVPAPAALPVATAIREVNQVSATLAEAGARLQASIAERDRAQAELTRLNGALQARVAEEVAAREEAQARLAQARRVEALGQLAGGIAHDFNNVLQAVQGGARLIQGEPADTGRVRRLAAMIAEAATRGAAITRRLLAFARRADLRAEPVDAGELLGTMREIFQHTLGAGIEVRVHVAPGVTPLLADKGQLETVLVNLATNARDAMAGAGVLTLSAVQETAGAASAEAGMPAPPGLRPGAYVRLSIADTGAGMDAATLARVAEPFFTTKQGGTGLGLAMARGFAEQSGGALLIDSAPGRGTTIRLWLPVAAAPVGTGPRAGTEPPDRRPRPQRHRILLVDDEALVRALTAEGLEAAGLAVLPVGSGAEALELLAAGEAVDLLVTDLSMPGMDGLALIRQAQERRPGLPAILLTGFATDMAELAVGGALSGRFSLLRKPIDARALAERATVMLEAARAAAAAPDQRRS